MQELARKSMCWRSSAGAPSSPASIHACGTRQRRDREGSASRLGPAGQK